MALTVGDVMTHNVITVSPQTPVTEAAERLAANRITGMPVVDEHGNLVGVISEFDIIGKSGRTVGEIMTRGVISVSPQTPLEEAAHILTGARIRRLHRAPHRDALDLFGLWLLRAWPAAPGPLSRLWGHHARVYAGTRARRYVISRQ
jgi:CBS-domain-containing membrane protein